MYNNYQNTNNGTTDFSRQERVVHPSEKIVIPEHTFVIDSRQRDTSVYPSPSYYTVELGQVYKNITSIELKGSVIPRSSSNVHSTNKYIDFSIGSTVTSIKLTGSGSGYTSAPVVSIDAPLNAGVQATATAIVNLTSGTITSIVIGVAGSGYSRSRPPNIYIAGPSTSGGRTATASAYVGTLYSAELRTGQYVIGGNPIPPATRPTDLIAEIQNAMNYAVNGSPYQPSSTGPFQVRIVSKYPEFGATLGTPEYYDTNGCLYNRISITNTNSDYWELLWITGPNTKRSAINLMGFSNIDLYAPFSTPIVTAGGGTLISAGTTYKSQNDYDLLADPQYVIISFWANEENFERIESLNESLNRKFGTLIFDANNSNVLTDLSGTTEIINSTDYLIGPVTKGSFYTGPGNLRPLKGFDFDQKKLEFSPAVGKLSHITIQFTKFGSSTGSPEYYDFAGRNHLLIFGIRSNDANSAQRW